MTMDTKTWILILIIVGGVIYFIYNRRKHQKEIAHLTPQGEPVADPLGNKHVSYTNLKLPTNTRV